MFILFVSNLITNVGFHIVLSVFYIKKDIITQRLCQHIQSINDKDIFNNI
mgnify:CR=1 FL=1